MKKLLLFLTLLVIAELTAWAHDPGLSGVSVQLQSDRTELTVSMAIRDACQLVPLDANHDGAVTADEFASGRDRLAEAVSAGCQIESDGVRLKSATASCRQDDAKNVSVKMNFAAANGRPLKFVFPLIRQLPFGHRMFFSSSDAGGKTLAEQLLTAEKNSVNLAASENLPSAPPTGAPAFLSFVLMGVEHIGTGYDHLLFLFALLVVTRSFRSALVVITAFTIAHSITLAVSAFNLVNISPAITEPAIAVTIIYVGLENFWRHGDPHKRWRLTFSFGLIHGFGFATALREMGVGQRPGGVLMPLLGFNLGVELGQLAVAAIVLPVVWKLRQREHFLRYGIPACSLAVAAAGTFWFVQRVWFK